MQCCYKRKFYSVIPSFNVSLGYVPIRVETGLGHPDYPGQPGHVLSGSSGSDTVYEISGSDPDSALDYVR